MAATEKPENQYISYYLCMVTVDFLEDPDCGIGTGTKNAGKKNAKQFFHKTHFPALLV
jgi:hypothetical protein